MFIVYFLRVINLQRVCPFWCWSLSLSGYAGSTPSLSLKRTIFLGNLISIMFPFLWWGTPLLEKESPPPESFRIGYDISKTLWQLFLKLFPLLTRRGNAPGRGGGTTKAPRALELSYEHCCRDYLKKIKKQWKKLRFSFLILGAEVLVTAFAATGCADRIAGIAMHTYFHVE